MAILPIVQYGETVLRQHGKKITRFDDQIKALAHDMIETVKASRGIGLAAQQVNRLERLIVIDLSLLDPTASAFALINPEIKVATKEPVIMSEGCLSFPSLHLDISRSKQVEVVANDLDGNPIHIQGKEMLARVLQHEIDHLNGTLFIDYINPLKRKFLLRDWERSRK